MSGRVAADPSIAILPYFAVRDCAVRIEGGRPQLAQVRTLSFRQRGRGDREMLATTFLPCALFAVENAHQAAQTAPSDGVFDTAATQLLATAKTGKPFLSSISKRSATSQLKSSEEI